MKIIKLQIKVVGAEGLEEILVNNPLNKKLDFIEIEKPL